jgi:hypothetical protein
VVKTPFQAAKPGKWKEFCCFGFDSFAQAQKFMQSLASARFDFRLQQRNFLADYPYEVILPGSADLARTLAYWDRRYPAQVAVKSQLQPVKKAGHSTTPAIAA